MKTKTKLAAILMLTLTSALAALSQQQSFTGVVTDSMCGAAHIIPIRLGWPCDMFQQR